MKMKGNSFWLCSICFSAVLFIAGCSGAPGARKSAFFEGPPQAVPEVPGQPYDWTITRQPERPYIHDYTKTFTTKIYLAGPTPDQKGSYVSTTFSEALDVIKDIDAMTLGVHKIIYLVGWQYLGHDSKYPAWHEVNESLKRFKDKTALDSLLWLFAEAEKYNTTLSLHINMWNAFDNSPLWQTYLDAGLITLDENGEPAKDRVWAGGQGYTINYKREWESGFAKKRIDELCAMLPIQKAGTIHIDAMVAWADPGHGDTLEEVQEGRRQIIRYWRELGVDVTSELIYNETGEADLIGLYPAVWNFSQTLDQYIERPASLISGINAADWYITTDGKINAELFGYQGCAEQIVAQHPLTWKPLMFDDFMQKNIKFFYLNTLERQSASEGNDDIRVKFSGDVESFIEFTDLGIGKPTATRKGKIMQEGADFCFPAPWYRADTAIAYSAGGGSFEYDLSAIMDWSANGEVYLTGITPSGLSNKKTKANLRGGKLEINLKAGNAVLIGLE
jgi:hypothetical protein